MSKKGALVSDDFKPKAIEDAEVIEITSKYKPRSYVLIHPHSKHIESLGIKDYFFWNQLKGQKTLAQLKQDYYQKFKALPTQHITELTHKWLEMGLIETDREIPKPSFEKRRGINLHFEKNLPIGLVRSLLGPIGLLICNPIASFIAVGLLVCAYSGLMVMYSPLVFFDAFSYPENTSTLLLGIIASLYLCAGIRLTLRMGTLYRKPRFIGDRLKLGFYVVFPTFRATRRGLLLKSWESRLYDLLASWVFPAALSGTIFFVCMLMDASPFIIYLAAIFALAGAIDLILCSCPFFNTTLIAMLCEYIGGFNIHNLTKLYFKNHNQFIEDRSRTERRAVFAYLALMFFWVVLGSSFLLFTTSKIAEGLTSQLNTTTNLSNDVIQYFHYGMYAPIFIAFIVLLWKLIQPYIDHIKQRSFWNEPHTMGIGLSLTSLILALGYYFLSDQFARMCLAAACFTHLMTIPRSTPHVPKWLKFHNACLIGNYALLGSQIIFPDLPYLEYGLGILWLSWHGYAIYTIMPKSVVWISIVCGGGLLTTVLLAVVPFMLGFSIGGNILFLLCAGLSLVLFGITWGGGVGLFFSLGSMAMLLLFFANGIAYPNPLGEAASVCAFFLLLFQYRGTTHILTHSSERITDFIDTEQTGEDHEGIELTMKNFISHCLGHFTVECYQKKTKKDSFLLNDYAQWVRKWVPHTSVVRILRIALTSIEWEKRPAFDKRVNGINITGGETKSNLSLDNRIQYLRNQLVFKGFRKSELKELASRLEMSVYKKGTMIASQDEPAHNYLEIITHGSVLMQQNDMNGQVHTLAEIGAGDAVRSEDLFKTSPYDSSFLCTKNVITLRLYRNHFIQWYQANPGSLERVMESIALAQMIMKLSLFRDFTPAQVRIVMERLKKKTAKPGEVIIKQGEEGDEFYLLDKGSVDIIINGNQVAQLGSGSYFGEIALLEKCKRTATVQANTKSSLYSLGQQDFEHFFSSGRSAQVLQNVSNRRTKK